MATHLSPKIIGMLTIPSVVITLSFLNYLRGRMCKFSKMSFSSYIVAVSMFQVIFFDIV